MPILLIAVILICLFIYNSALFESLQYLISKICKQKFYAEVLHSVIKYFHSWNNCALHYINLLIILTVNNEVVRLIPIRICRLFFSICIIFMVLGQFRYKISIAFLLTNLYYANENIGILHFFPTKVLQLFSFLMLESEQHFNEKVLKCIFVRRRSFPWQPSLLLRFRAADAAVSARYTNHSSRKPSPTALLFAIFFLPNLKAFCVPCFTF